MRRSTAWALALATAAAATSSLVGTSASGTGGAAAAGPPVAVSFVQAVPATTVDITVDGQVVAHDVRSGDVVNVDLTPGKHRVSFSGEDVAVDTTVGTGSGGARDVVLHLPSEVDGAPLVHSYRAPSAPIGPGKARVVLAHTATVAPADVEVDGRTVFTNIANGEFAQADVPAGTIEVALLPSGTRGKPILGPLDLPLDAGTLTMVYAYGSPRDGSMAVVAHVSHLAADGSVVPARIETGSAGLVTGRVVILDRGARPAARPGG